MKDVIVFALGPMGAFAPKLNASRPTGGTELHAVQLVHGFRERGLDAIGISELPKDHIIEESFWSTSEVANGACLECDALVSMACGVPTFIKPNKHAILFTHDPHAGQNPQFLMGMRWSRFVAVSKWQARRFPMGIRVAVIPPIIDDWIYELPKKAKQPGKYVCFSAWWKGGAETLIAWEQLAPKGATLYFGSPYSHPPNLREVVEHVPNCKYVDLANPRAIVEEMRDAEAVFRVCKNPETAGITDAIAAVLGCRTHVFCPTDVGGLAETLGPRPSVTNDYAQFQSELRRAAYYEAPPSYRAKDIMPKWLNLLEVA